MKKLASNQVRNIPAQSCADSHKIFELLKIDAGFGDDIVEGSLLELLKLFKTLDIAQDGFPGVFQGLLLGFSLGVTTIQSRHNHVETSLFSGFQNDIESHWGNLHCVFSKILVSFISHASHLIKPSLLRIPSRAMLHHARDLRRPQVSRLSDSL